MKTDLRRYGVRSRFKIYQYPQKRCSLACNSFSKRRNAVKLLRFEGDGFAIFYKKDKHIHAGYLWCYNSSIEKLVFFDYRPGRGEEHTHPILKDFKGIIQTYGWQVYQNVAKKVRISSRYAASPMRDGNKKIVLNTTRTGQLLHWKCLSYCTI